MDERDVTFASLPRQSSQVADGMNGWRGRSQSNARLGFRRLPHFGAVVWGNEAWDVAPDQCVVLDATQSPALAAERCVEDRVVQMLKEQAAIEEVVTVTRHLASPEQLRVETGVPEHDPAARSTSFAHQLRQVASGSHDRSPAITKAAT